MEESVIINIMECEARALLGYVYVTLHRRRCTVNGRQMGVWQAKRAVPEWHCADYALIYRWQICRHKVFTISPEKLESAPSLLAGIGESFLVQSLARLPADSPRRPAEATFRHPLQIASAAEVKLQSLDGC